MGIAGLLMAGMLMFFLAFLGFKVYFNEQPQRKDVLICNSTVTDAAVVSEISGGTRAGRKFVEDVESQVKIINKNEEERVKALENGIIQ